MAPELLAESVLVVMVDLAEGPLRSVGSISKDELRANARALAELCRILDIPVILAKAPFPPPGDALIPEVGAHAQAFTQVPHSTNDSWKTPAFVEAVRATGRRQIAFAGIALEVGVALTALSAIRSGFETAVLTDVCGSVNAKAEQAALLRLAHAGAVLTTWSAFAGEIAGDYTKGNGPQVLRLVASKLFQIEAGGNR